MRKLILLACLMAVPAVAASPAYAEQTGWASVVGKTCQVRNVRGGAEAKFMQDATGPTVQLRAKATKVVSVTLTPPNTMHFDAAFNADGYTFTYDEKSKAWAGSFAGQPSFLMCP
jgi:hypothetical protein